jgi:D-inositol-3-phosphate glycosyltransferase
VRDVSDGGANAGDGPIRRRIRATRRVWHGGPGHLAMLPDALAREPDAPELPGGHVDLPFADSVLPRAPLLIRGWAMFPAGLPTRVELWLGERYLGAARLGGHRPDLHHATGMPAALVSEWEHVVDLSSWDGPLGYLSLRTRATGPAGERVELEPVPVRVARPDEQVPPGDARTAPAPPVAPMLSAQRPPLHSVRPDRAGDRPRVLVFTHQLDLGGAQLYLLDLMRGLRALGLGCTVVSPLDGELRERLEELGVGVHISTPLPIDSPRRYASRIEELAGWAAHGRYDVVLVNTVLAFGGAEVAALLGLPAVWAIHESYDPPVLWWMFGKSLHPEVRARAEAALAGAAVGLFVARATSRQYEPYVGSARCVTLPYGLDFEALARVRARFDRAAARRERGVPDGARVVLCVGTIEPRKAQVPLVQAFGLVADRHPDARLVFLGGRKNGHTRLLEQYVKTCAPEGRVEVLPMQSDVWPWYGLADLMVCASDVESLPRSVLEAMAWETPVVATQVFGVPELIEHGETGWLCPPRDVEALAGALDTALSADADALRRIGAAARALVERRHALEPYAAACARLLSDVAAGESGLAVAGD